MDELTTTSLEPVGSERVNQATQGLYDIIRMGVRCQSFKGGHVTITNTLVKLIESIGWLSEFPNHGLMITVFGDPEFKILMTEFCRTLGIPYQIITYWDSAEAAEEDLMNHLRQLTHYVEFVEPQASTESVYAKNVFIYGISHLRVVLP